MSKTAVIYARYSCAKQREVSIDDQLRVCQDYCDREGIKVMKTYCDYAISGKGDQRPEFQAMIVEAPLSDYVVVYMMERFSRGKYDPSIYKSQLEKKGVRVISALEYIPDAPEGILMEKILEGQAAYFSLDVARKTRRGMESNARKAMYNGYKIFGYGVDSETKHYVIDDAQAEIVRDIFSRYIGGETINSIGWRLAMQGVKTSTGKPAEYGFIHRIINNDRYMGIYRWNGIEVAGGMPQIIDEATFRAAQGTVRKKVKANESHTYYPLSGKLYCAICGNPMHGATGTSGGNGKKYYYYQCKKGSVCGRKPLRKEVIEDAIAGAVTKLVSDENELRRIADIFVQVKSSKNETAVIRAAEKRLQENKKALANVITAIEQGMLSPEIKTRFDNLNIEQGRLVAEVARLKVEADDLDPKELVAFLQDVVDLHDQGLVLEAFVNRVYVFDGYAVATLNYRQKNNELAEIRCALESLSIDTPGVAISGKKRTPQVDVPFGEFVQNANGAPSISSDEQAIVILNGAIGLIVQFAA